MGDTIPLTHETLCAAAALRLGTGPSQSAMARSKVYNMPARVFLMRDILLAIDQLDEDDAPVAQYWGRLWDQLSTP
jgi:hypothetical protein